MEINRKYIDGPFLQVACFCDLVLEDKTNAISLIRIIDTIYFQEVGPDVPDEMAPHEKTLNLVVMLKSGNAIGRNSIKIVPEQPNGETSTQIEHPIFFEGEEKGVNIILHAKYLFRMEGLYLFRVYLDDVLVTVIPLKIKYVPLKSS